MAIISEPFARNRFDLLASFLSNTAAHCLPGPSLLMPGDLAWRLPGSDPKRNLRLFHDESGLAGYAWFEPDTGFEFDLRPDLTDNHELIGAIVAWSESRRRQFPPAYPRFVDLLSMEDWAREINNPAPRPQSDERYLTTVAFESQRGRLDALQSAGYEPTGHFAPLYRRDLSQIIEIEPPDPPGRLRSVTQADLSSRVDVHRGAWLGSSWDLEKYTAIRSSPAYREDLDIVYDTGQSFASYCICWADPDSGIGIFEPVGTRPEWRGKGVGRAVILEGMRRLQDLGMDYAQVGTAGFNEPAQRLYESCGFTRHDTLRTFMKVLL